METILKIDILLYDWDQLRLCFVNCADQLVKKNINVNGKLFQI